MEELAGKEIPEAQPKDALSLAQDIIYDAWEKSNRKERIRMARKALSISPDCADAYSLLAEEEAQTFEEAKGLYEKAVKAGERELLGRKVLKRTRDTFGASSRRDPICGHVLV